MDELADQQLLRDYAEKKSEAAFAELARRYVDLVYSAALRMVSDTHAAKDVTQEVFVALAQNARQLAGHPVLAGWLHQTTRNLAANSIRASTRRSAREQEAATMNEILGSQAEAGWDQIAPQLDDALHELSKEDRDALLLRYFQRKSAQEMAASLGISSEAAQKRVNRAVDRLRETFAKRGVAVGAGGLVVALSANAVHAAPAGFAATVSTAATLTGATAATATKIIAMTTLQKIIVTTAITVAVGAGIYEAQQAAHWRDEFNRLQQQQSADMARLQKETDAATRQAAALRTEMASIKSNDAELLRLRGKLTKLGNDAEFGPSESSMKSWADRVALLRQKLEQMPQRKIAELGFATEKDWADAAWKADLTTDDGVRQALSKLREEAINTFLNKMMQDAMRKYLVANNNVVPPDLYVLKPYFDEPVTDEMLSHYQLMQTGTLNDSADLVTLTSHADDEYDSNHAMSINGASGGVYNKAHEAVDSAINGFATDNPGQMPTDASQLQNYLKQPIDPTTVKKYLDEARARR